jgi:uncharacterized repeat protein (TIGR01451 family)
MNETNVTIQEAENQTGNITLPESQNVTYPENEIQTNITLPEILQPILGAEISSTDKIIRGEQFDISAVVKNSGNSDARNVVLSWELPSGFEIVSGDFSKDCGEISPESECISSITLSSSISTDIGKSEIKVILKYEE